MLYFTMGLFVGTILLYYSINSFLKKNKNITCIIFNICGVFLCGLSLTGFFIKEELEVYIYVGLLLFTFIPILIYLLNKERK